MTTDPGRCPGPSPASLLEGTCRVVPGGGDLLIRGTLLLPQGTLENGELLVHGGRITCAGCDCPGAGATRIECPLGVISPGLINPHDHLGWTRSRPAQPKVRYDHRHEWRKGQNGKPKLPCWQVDFSQEAIAWGEVRMLLGGATSIMGEGSVKGLLRNLDWDNEGLDRFSVKNTTFPLGDKEGQTLTQKCSYPELPSVDEVQKAVAWVPHVAEGVGREARNEFLCLSGQQAGGVDVTRQNTSLIHAVGITARDAERIATSRARVIWSPRSNLSLYGNTADVVLLHNLGVPIALGTDWVISGSMNMLRELACAERLNRLHYDGAFTEAEIWQMATGNAALSAGLGDILGKLSKGYAADVVVFDGRQHASPYAAVIQARAPDVALVLRGGEVLHGDAELVAALVPGGGQGCELLEVCQVAKRLCLERQIGIDLALLKGRLSGETYPLFFCGPPEGEPTCVPSRPGSYDGKVSAGDRDGDGIKNAVDNCPLVFNPPRPLDDGVQPDTDGDGQGDACDRAPFESSK